MANYYGWTKTNSIKVKNKDIIDSLMRELSSEGEIYYDLIKTEEEGVYYFDFAVDGLLWDSYYFEIEDEEGNTEEIEKDINDWYKELSKNFIPGEVLAVTQIGHEKLRYVDGDITFIGSNSAIWYKSLDQIEKEELERFKKENGYEN